MEALKDRVMGLERQVMISFFEASQSLMMQNTTNCSLKVDSQKMKLEEKDGQLRAANESKATLQQAVSNCGNMFLVFD